MGELKASDFSDKSKKSKDKKHDPYADLKESYKEQLGIDHTYPNTTEIDQALLDGVPEITSEIDKDE